MIDYTTTNNPNSIILVEKVMVIIRIFNKLRRGVRWIYPQERISIDVFNSSDDF